MKQTNTKPKAHAGQIYRCGRRHIKIMQIRDGSPGLSYALVRHCTARGELKRHRFLGVEYITTYLLPDRTIGFSYELVPEVTA